MSLVSICILPITAILVASVTIAASKWPQWPQRITFDLRFEIRNLNFHCIHMQVAPNSHFGGLRGHGGLKTASEFTSDLGIELSDLNYLCCHVFLISNCLYILNETEVKWLPLTSEALRARS